MCVHGWGGVGVCMDVCSCIIITKKKLLYDSGMYYMGYVWYVGYMITIQPSISNSMSQSMGEYHSYGTVLGGPRPLHQPPAPQPRYVTYSPA